MIHKKTASEVIPRKDYPAFLKQGFYLRFQLAKVVHPFV